MTLHAMWKLISLVNDIEHMYDIEYVGSYRLYKEGLLNLSDVKDIDIVCHEEDLESIRTMCTLHKAFNPKSDPKVFIIDLYGPKLDIFTFDEMNKTKLSDILDFKRDRMSDRDKIHLNKINNEKID